MSNRPKGLRDQTGASKLTLLVFGAILAAAVYSGYKIIPFYYAYFELQNQMEQVVRLAQTLSDAEVREKIEYHIEHLDIPVETRDLKVSRDGGFLKVGLEWQEVFYVTFRGKDYEIHTFDFHAHAESRADVEG